LLIETFCESGDESKSIWTPVIRTSISLLRPLATTWIVCALLPAPMILLVDPSENSEVSCLYLGLACAYLALQVIRAGGIPEERFEWWAKIGAICVAVGVNLTLFIALGLAAGVQTHLPFALTAALSVIPSIGLVPWLALKIRKPLHVMVLGAVIVLTAKLVGCVIARMVYGPYFNEEGYIAGDWRTAKLMISFFWICSTAISLGMLLAGHWQLRRGGDVAQRQAIA
jgi:hypothetical protein